MVKTPKKLILIDGNAIIHRAYHALPPLSTKTGELVNAVYGFSSTLLSVIDQLKPDYVAASFDLAGPTFRHVKFDQYKANRAKADDALYAQIPRVKQVVEAFNIPIYEKAGFEADDVIGTIANQAKSMQGPIETIIVTGDMDALQLVDATTKVYTMKRGLSDSIIYDEEKVIERYGIKPSQLKDYKGLRGDPSDNIPGVKGVGEKTATTLLQKYHDIDGIYRHIDELKGAIKDKLERDKANAILSKELGTIRLDVPVQIDLEKAELHDFDREKIVRLFSGLNFFSLIKRLPFSIPTNYELNTNVRITNDAGVKDFKYVTATEKDAQKLIEEFLDAKEISVAFEEKAGIAISHKTGRATFFPLSEKIPTKLKNVLEKAEVKKIGYDLKTIFKQLKNISIDLRGIASDVMLAAYVLNPGEKINLEKLVLSELGEEISFEEKSKGQLSLVANEDEDKQKIAHITCQKADYALKLKYALEKKIAEISGEQQRAARTSGTLKTVFENIEMPLVEILGEMEIAGIEINPVIFAGISEKITGTLKNLERSIYDLAGKEFNINSPSQLSEILFTVLKLPTDNIKKTKTKLSTAAAELEKLRGVHKIIPKIEEYRELFKLKTTYLDAIPKLIDKNSRIHTTFNQAVTATGRLSSTEPNLQNIPIKTALGQLLRTAFVAEGGYKLISADYSQIDLRAVAHVSNDKKLIEAFQRGDDIHKLTAAEVNKVTPSQVTETMRSSAKALNFGVIYGMGAYGFSKSAGISRDEAQQFINTYMEKFSGVAEYMKNTREFAKKNGYVETLFGRRRNIAEINSPNIQVANGAERMAINMPIQGLSADIVKLAMVNMTHELGTNYNLIGANADVRMILQIHDEIILEVKENIANEVAKKVKDIMENACTLSVPLIAAVKIGNNWGEI